MNIRIRKHMATLAAAFIALAVLASSCSSNDYVNAIPASATALMKFKISSMDDTSAAQDLLNMIGVENVRQSGIDLSNDVYVFETVDGNLGLCAKVGDMDKITDMLGKMADKGKATRPSGSGDIMLADINGSWCVGYNKSGILMVGPVSATLMADTKRTIMKLLKQDSERSVVTRPAFAKIDTMTASISLVAQVQALPEKLAAPLTIGAPKDADPSQIWFAADIANVGGNLIIRGTPFSFDATVDKGLRDVNSNYRKIGTKYIPYLDRANAFAVMLNVDGTKFLPMLQSSKALQALLVGMNTAIDFDNVIRSVNGDMLIASAGFSGTLSLNMRADISRNPAWVKDVEYWRQSCPAGATITANGDNAWVYSSGATKLYFGIHDGAQFYCTTKMPEPIGTSCGSLIDADAAMEIGQSRFALVVNPSAFTGGMLSDSGANHFATALGKLKTIIYVMK